ncbi:MAG: hypothetical protein JW760_12595 [Spirochaetales bacterium]|nr:hypothetical protein [Spirochaetales bacterium]
MEKISNEIRLYYSDNGINTTLASGTKEISGYTRHFNQNEEFFINIPQEIRVPHFPIHHDVRVSKPSDFYLQNLRKLVEELTLHIPEVFENLIYFFDPAEILRPCFFQLYRVGEQQYVYLLRLDLLYRTHEHTIVEPGDNDRTPSYVTNNVFLEADMIPLAGTQASNGKMQSFQIKQTISQTWIGQTGRGYFVQGIWMDNELTKFFSKLFSPDGKSLYPYYPFTCKYRTICHSVLDLSFEGRKKHLPYLHRAMSYLIPRLPSVEKALKNKEFTPDLPAFLEMKNQVPDFWNRVWDSFQVSRYLNNSDMREYRIDL